MLLKDSSVGKTEIEVSDNSVKTRLDARKQYFQEACSGLALSPEQVKGQRDLELTLAHGKLKFCGLEKVGSTFLRNVRRKEDEYSAEEKYVKDFKSFVVVREPYGRLVSAYIDKILLRPVWWRTPGRFIAGHFRFRAENKHRDCGSDITFHEFIRFWMYMEETSNWVNGHFLSMHKECKFCFFNYDYYVHLETMKDEMYHIYQSVNATLLSTMTNDQDTLKDMAVTIVQQRDDGQYRRCVENCDMLDRAWWTFQGRALIAPDVIQPFKGDKCNTITKTEFANAAIGAHMQSKDRIDKQRQKRQTVVSLFLQVPLLERLKVRDLLMEDFKLHNYDSLPEDIFPEVYES